MANESSVDTVLNNRQPALLGCVITPWHAIGLKALSLYLEDSGLVESKYAIIQMHSANGQLIQARDLKHFDVIQILRPLIGFKEKTVAALCRTLFFRNQVTQEGIANLYIACPGYPGSYARTLDWANCKRAVTVYLLDEGLGSYLCNAKDWVKWSTKDMSLSGIQAFLRRTLGVFDKLFFPQIRRKLTENGRFKSFRLLDEHGNPNDVAIKYYRKSMALESAPEREDENYINAIVINTQPLVEDGFVDQDEYVRAITVAVEQAHSVGANVVIKPHPREKHTTLYEALGCYVERREGVSQESIFAALGGKGPCCLAGFNSTTLFSCELLFGIKCMSLLRLLDLGKCSDDYIASTRRFYQFVKDRVAFPKTAEDFQALCEECFVQMLRADSPLVSSARRDGFN